MKLAVVLFAALSFWCLSCAMGQKKSTFHDVGSMWPPIIWYLNQEPDSSIESLDARVDLSQKYRSELAQIDARWRRTIDQAWAPKERRAQENKYFYEEINKLNEEDFQKLKLDRFGTERSVDRIALAGEVLKTIESDSSASTKRVENYEEGDQIGFCFGRALLAHYLLLKAGVPQHDIFKVFALGDLYVGGQFWRFHVAVMMRDGAGFIVVDPLYGEATSYENWIANVSRLEIKKPYSRARFYIVDPRKFMPASGLYDVGSLSQPQLKDYFQKIGLQLAQTAGF